MLVRMGQPQHSRDEFRFLSGDAARIGLEGPLPSVTRFTETGGTGQLISGLAFHWPHDTPRPGEHTASYVFLHGAGLNAHTFDPTILALGEDARSFDLPGHGRSDWRADADYAPTRLADDLLPAIAAQFDGPVHLVGQSLGGLTAAAIAARAPELVESITIVDITPGIVPQADARAVTEFITGQRTYASVEEIVDRAVEFGIGTDRTALARGVELNTRLRPDGLLEWSHHFAHLPDLGQGASHSDAAAQHTPYAGLWRPLREFDDRVRLIRATHGIVSDALSEEWAAELPHAPIVTIEGGHNLQEHAPSDLARAILAARAV